MNFLRARVCRGLLLVPVFLVPMRGAAAIYTKCEQAAESDCLPGEGTQTLPSEFTITADGSATLDSVFNWKVRNCKNKTGFLRGQLTLIMDNSKSAESTDPSATRAGIVNAFMDRFLERALVSGVDDQAAGYPQLALVNYNGRVGTTDANNPIDAYNIGFTPSYCSSSSPAFPDAAAKERWSTADQATGIKYSLCEYLPLRAVTGATSIFPLQEFVNFATRIPRGSTDFVYFFRAAASIFSAPNTANIGRNVLLVTDGLPNIPKNVASATCRSEPRLRNEQIVFGTLQGVEREYCVDRQAVSAVAAAHNEALKSDYSKINFHHVLYTESQRAYFDYQTDGSPTLNPADFLIENSARTGNGKVKFSYARTENDLSNRLSGILDQMDSNALQFVRVSVQPAGGGTPIEYNAVSPAEPGKDFSIKFIGLKTGLNTVTVTPVYQDGTSATKTIKVTVGAGPTAGMSCSQADDSKTVDGDAIGTKQPKGDGFYNQPNSNGDLRDYRNSDDANSLSDREFAIVGDEQSSEDLTKLRLQGGTGNCGSVMSRAGGTTGGSLFFAALGLMVLPLLMAAGLALRTRKRWK